MSFRKGIISQQNAAEYYQQLEKSQIPCPTCNSNDQQELFARDRYRMGIKTVGCRNCGMIFINPRPTPSAMQNFYQSHYRKFYEAISHPNKEYVANGPFEARAQFVVKVLSEAIVSEIDTNSPTTKLLDIGCSEGTLLRHFGEVFPKLECHGIEPDPNFADYARATSGSRNIETVDFEGFFQQNKNSFDLVTLTHVLEHILEPLEVLNSIYKLMAENGYLYVEVPNVMDPEMSGIANIHLAHVLSFSPQSLSLVLRCAGFEIVAFYEKDLPAKTKSMAAVCKKATARFVDARIDKSEIQKQFADYRSRVQKIRKRNNLHAA